MKIIVSHDIDHHKVSDHIFRDLYIPKFIVRNFILLLKGKLSFQSWLNRMRLFRSNSMGYIEDLISFNEKYGVESVFFIGFDNALNLSYSQKCAKKFTHDLSNRNFDNYPHGIAYGEKLEMKKEMERWKSALPKPRQLAGIRMHYLRSSEHTDAICAELGYDFVSNRFGLGDPFLSSGVIHFPVALMDVYSLSYSEEDAATAIEDSIRLIEKARENGQKYFTIIFHDHHYCKVFQPYKDWYEATIKYLAGRFEFTTFEKAIIEIKQKSK